MKAPLYLWPALAASIFSLTGCHTQSPPRVLRLALGPNGFTWRFAVDGVDRGRALSSPELTNAIMRLRPRWGDALLLDCPPTPPSGQVETAERWLFHLCDSERVAVNLIHGYSGVDMFSVPAYHWTAPFENPFDLAHASFFREGKLLGRGTNGFETILQQIARERPRQIFILGSKYDMDRSFGPNSSPFEKQRDQLYSVLKAAGTDFIQLDPLP